MFMHEIKVTGYETEICTAVLTHINSHVTLKKLFYVFHHFGISYQRK